MSSIVGATAISLASTPGAVEERPFARVFRVRGSGETVHTVVLYSELGQDVCTCRAGQRGARCSHAAAAHLTVARELREAGRGVA